jgi:hypothetical protein
MRGVYLQLFGILPINNALNQKAAGTRTGSDLSAVLADSVRSQKRSVPKGRLNLAQHGVLGIRSQPD